MENPMAIRQFWLDHVTRWKKSSLNQKEWCSAFGLKRKTFNWWKRKLFPRKSIKETVLIAFPNAQRIFLYDHPIDIHSSFETLSQRINESIPNDMQDFSYFIFLSTRRTYLKVFYHDEDGPNILFKRLERGAFVLDRNAHPKIGDFSII